MLDAKKSVSVAQMTPEPKTCILRKFCQFYNIPQSGSFGFEYLDVSFQQDSCDMRTNNLIFYLFTCQYWPIFGCGVRKMMNLNLNLRKSIHHVRGHSTCSNGHFLGRQL